MDLYVACRAIGADQLDTNRRLAVQPNLAEGSREHITVIGMDELAAESWLKDGISIVPCKRFGMLPYVQKRTIAHHTHHHKGQILHARA